MAIQFDNTNTGVATLKPAASGTISLTLPAADGTTGQALTTNGSGQLAFSTVGGGVTGFTGTESTAAPNATVYVDSLTASAASTNADVALVAKGTGATLAQIPNSTTAGGNKRGEYAIDLQRLRTTAAQVASGNKAIVLGGENNTASGNNSFVTGGYENTASGTYSACVAASSSIAGGLLAVVVAGDSNNCQGAISVIVGGQSNTAYGDYTAVIGGKRGFDRTVQGYTVFPASAQPISTISGGNQAGLLILGRQTTNETPITLTSNSSSANTGNQVILPNNSAYYFRGSITAGVTGAGNSAMWSFEGGIKRGANAATTTIVQSVINQVAADAGASTWTVALTADATNGGLAVTVTGQAATTIRWVCKIETTEMTY